MTFEEIVQPIKDGEKTTQQVFSTKYSRRAWAEGDYLGVGPSGFHPNGLAGHPRPTLVVMRDEPYGTLTRNWDTADADREADDWYEVEEASE